MGPVVVLKAVSSPGSGLEAPVWWAGAFAYVAQLSPGWTSANVEADD
jgi:hypothetical protein